ncbi:beta-lactamase [Pedosphaera parvula Ellin514]|uniref:beta-lactamase n=2 Tax=Pedosphaera TaxID=1032526 RepID=B9XGI6_PEDPL|nr:beta-lactamase [Pedosphaera parvula Ellin514]
MQLIRTKTETQLQEIISHTRGAMGISVLDLTSNDRFDINAEMVFPQASAIKIPVLMEVYKQAHAGKFSLTDTRRIEKQDKTSGSGILFELGDGTVQMTIHDLCILMILISDNTATNLLIDLVGITNVNQTLNSLGFEQTRLQRRMMDAAASLRGDENLSTPAEGVRILELLHKGEFINRSICDDILAILKKPKPTNLTAGLPDGTVVATKPGNISGVATEWAIVYLKDRPYIVVIMENYGVEHDAPDAMKAISQTLHEYFARLSRATKYGAYVAPSVQR